MCDVIRPAVAGEKERGNRRITRVMRCGNVELKEVEERQRGEEEGDAPERCWLEKGEEECDTG